MISTADRKARMLSKSQSKLSVPTDLVLPKAHKEKPKHIMLSYQWGSQKFAKELHELLSQRGFNVWIDTQNMTGDIYESMSYAVLGASVFVPVLTPEYGSSDNCKRECQGAAVAKVPMVPIKLANFNPTGWLYSAVPAGTLWTEFYERELSSQSARAKLEVLFRQIESHLPEGVKRTKPKVFIANAKADSNYARILKRKFEALEKNNNNDIGYECIILNTSGGVSKGEEDIHSSGDESTSKKEIALESKLRDDVIAVILILTPSFEEDDECRNIVSLAYSFRKKIVPTVWEPLSGGYPPQLMEFCLKTLSFVDFTKIQVHGDNIKVKIKVEHIRKRIEDISTSQYLTTSDNNFQIKVVGEWTALDVSNWLEWIGLIQYSQPFLQECINGRMLLSLTDKELELLKLTKLHQKVLYSNINDLLSSAGWNYEDVAVWVEGLQLEGVKDKLQDAGIDSKHLFMLVASDLQTLGITSPIVQERLLQDIFQLKLQLAKVPVGHEMYRFSVLKDVLLPIATDQIDKFKFHRDLFVLMKVIYDSVDQQRTGLSLSGLKQFLMTLLLVVHVYKKSYPTKIIWFDANLVEISCLHRLVHRLVGDTAHGGKCYIREMLDACATRLSSRKKKNKLQESEAGIYLVPPHLAKDPLFDTLFLYYSTLNNLITRLFAVWDRSVNGSVGWTELLAGLNLLVLEPFRTKFKLAFALVDFNGDGELWTGEFTKFYTECFLSVTKFLKDTQPDIFPTLDRYSALYSIYEHVKSDLGEKPHYLNDDFAIAFYNGGCFENNRKDHGIEQAMAIRTVHSSMEGTNFDFILEVKDKIVLTNLVVGGNFNGFTSYLKDALIWFSETKPNFKAYSSKFDNFSREQFNALPQDAPNRPNLFVSTDPTTTLYYLEIEPPIKLAYIHVKFLRPHPGGKHRNIDLEFIGMWGYYEELPKKRVKVSSVSLYAELGGRVDEEEEWVRFTEGQVTPADDNVAPYVAECVKAAKNFTDGQELPRSALLWSIKQDDVEKLLDMLDFVEAEDGGMHMNQASILHNMMPIVHLFRLFYGYPAMQVLQSPM
jgi:hypothetical protein